LVPEEGKPQSWFQTVPAILTAIGATLSAITGLILALNQIGVLGGSRSATPPPAAHVSSSIAATTSGEERPSPVEPRAPLAGGHSRLAGLWSGPVIFPAGNRVERTLIFRRLADGSFTVEALRGDCVTAPCVGRLQLAGGEEIPDFNNFRANAEITIYKTVTDLGIMYYSFERGVGDPPETLNVRMHAKYWRNGLPHQHSNEMTVRLTRQGAPGGPSLPMRQPAMN
jgi:hypothetical protein